MKKLTHSILILVLVVFPALSIHSVAIPTQTTPLKIVTSTALIGDFVENVGGEFVDVSQILVEGDEDPHTYEPVPSEITALIEADLFFLMGREGLEPWWENWEESIMEDNPDLLVIKVMNETMVEVDELTGENNPHGWMSPNIAKDMIYTIYAELNAHIASEDQAGLLTNYQNYDDQLDQLLVEIEGNRTNFEGVKVIVHHPAFKYLYDLLGIERIGVIEEQHDVEPSAQHIQEIKNLIEDENVELIIHQTNLDEEEIMQIARDTNSQIVWGAPLIGMTGNDGNQILSYIQLIRYNIWALQNPTEPSEAGNNTISGYSSLLVLTLTTFAFMALGGYSLYKRKKIGDFK